jgi:hypothetical protein
MDSEIWKDISGYEGFYQVSSIGRVRSLDQNIRSSFRPAVLPGRIRKVWKHKGYHGIYLSKMKKRRAFLVHRLVAIAFLQPDPERPHVNHKNHNRSDNRIENLEWVTPSENMIHRFTKPGASTLLEIQGSDVAFLRSLDARGVCRRKLERIFKKIQLDAILGECIPVKFQ